MQELLTKIKFLGNLLEKETVENEVQCKFFEHCTPLT